MQLKLGEYSMVPGGGLQTGPSGLWCAVAVLTTCVGITLGVAAVRINKSLNAVSGRLPLSWVRSSSAGGSTLTTPASFYRRTFIGVALFLLLATFSLKARTLGEYEVKAAFLLNFTKFVEWPPRAYAETNAPVIIGIVGEDPFGDVLTRIVQGQTAQGRPIVIRHFKADEDVSSCHVLFLSRSVSAQTGEILRRVQGLPLLTVSEKDDFVRQGGVIGFAVADKSVRFDVNTKTAETAELKVSSKLLAVARTVVKSS